MIKPKDLCQFLDSNEISFYVGVPDSLLKSFCGYLSQALPSSSHIIAANEGNALAIGTGYHLGTGKLPLIYLQNSGLGNLVNPLISLADKEVYSIPMLLMIGWRGEPELLDEPQHMKQGRITPSLLDCMEIPWFEVNNNVEQSFESVHSAIDYAKSHSCPAALLVRKNVFAASQPSPVNPREESLSREDAICAIAQSIPSNALVVCTTGMASRELYEYRDSLSQGHDRDFLTVGSMGHASSIAYGLALSVPNRSVFCIDGDGSLLMHLGASCIIGSSHTSNLFHIVLNNGVHDSVGGQPTVGKDVNLTKIAQASGYHALDPVDSIVNLQKAIEAGPQLNTPTFLEVLVAPGSRNNLGRPLTTPLQNKSEFMRNILLNE